jgi:uncharacterized oxidoreductase
MHPTGNTILVTGGGSGIGLALAGRLLVAGHTVIACGRRESALRAAADAHPGLVTRVCDLAREEARAALVAWVVDAFPALDVVVNNAGIQRRVRLAEPEPWATTREELAINLDAPIDLTLRLLPHLRARPAATVVNVTSGLSFAPYAAAAVYSATKAALHSFTLSLRHQLADTPVRVVEILPPAVNTDLGGPGLHATGAPLAAFADEVVARLLAGELEIAYGTAEPRNRAAHEAFDAVFERINGRPPL